MCFFKILIAAQTAMGGSIAYATTIIIVNNFTTATSKP